MGVKMPNFMDQVERLVQEYRGSGESWPATAQEMAEWMVANDRYELTRGMAIQQCAQNVARAMRLQHVRDHKGRSVRKYYSARFYRDGKQTALWGDWDAELPFMEVAVANRR